jgi:predicted ATP-dependent endonuclease of OLD family
MGRSSRNQPLFTSTTFSRRFFGDFVPWINYPSPYEVGQRISSEALQALNDVSSTDRALLSKAFLEIFSTLSSSGTSARQHDNPDAILSAIKDLSEQLSILGISNGPSSDEQVYSTLRTMIPSVQFREGLEEVYAPVLQIYREALEERVRVQNSSSSLIRLYLDSVNNFLEGKRLSIRRRDDIPIPLVQVEFEDNTFGNIQSLSSGERQIVTIIYASTHMSGQEVVLIDEPEISLHIDWQIKLLPSLSEQLNDKQIITCTHSPVIASGYEEQMVELRLTASQTLADSVIKEDDDSEELL